MSIQALSITAACETLNDNLYELEQDQTEVNTNAVVQAADVLATLVDALQKVLAVGSSVTFGNMNGTVTAICIRGGNVTYEVAWVHNGVRRNEWFEDFELTPTAGEAAREMIGFK